MKELTGKTIVFTDLHVGLSNNRESKLRICENVVKQIGAATAREKASNIIFCGDWFHSRTMLDVNSVNVALRLMEELASKADVYMVLGNHDLYMKDSVDVNSVNMFKSMDRVHIVEKTELFSMNGLKCAFIPWLGELDGLEKDSLDFMFGHFEVSSKYLTQSYFEEHRAKQKAGQNTSEAVRSSLGAAKSGELVGNFVDPLKKTGTLFAGHIHQHKEFLAKGKKFIFVGSPYQQNMGEYGCETGYYVIDAAGKYSFKHTSAPVHVRVLMSDVAGSGIDSYDFKTCSGNIVQKVYDVETDPSLDQAVNERIAAAMPYEEMLPDYMVEPADARTDLADQDFSAASIQKSKLSYIKNYIDKMDKNMLKESGVDADKLFKFMAAYYEKAVG